MAELPICKCGDRVVLLTSWTEDNPGRRFYSCKLRYSNNHCQFFLWLDPPIEGRPKEIINYLRRRLSKYERQNRTANQTSCNDLDDTASSLISTGKDKDTKNTNVGGKKEDVFSRVVPAIIGVVSVVIGIVIG
ncbi:hypothetical protein LINGRAHAP2_LOCUS29423 [Linum grandiflorum]